MTKSGQSSVDNRALKKLKHVSIAKQQPHWLVEVDVQPYQGRWIS